VTALLLILLPLVAASAVLAGLARGRATWLLIGVSCVTSAVAVLEAAVPHALPPDYAGFVCIDATSRLFLAVVDPIFLGVAVYVGQRARTTPELLHEAVRFAWMGLVFLSACNAVVISGNLVGQWIALEATTLAVAPLILRSGSSASRRASWRYLLFSSVGLGFVLLGFLCLGRGLSAAGQEPTFFFAELLASAPHPANDWTKLGIALVLLGLGTKLGLAPMYTWLPEAYDEAPPPVAALLGAVQFNCALVLLFRVVEAFRPGHEELITGQLVTMGVLSMVVSTVSIIATRNIRRLIAYASINHAGVIAIGLGLGKTAAYGLLLYVLSNAFIKAILFLSVGKIGAHYRTKDTRQISGLIKDLPYSGLFLMVGTFALLGFPPFGSFLGELLILSALVSSGKMLVFAAFCVLISMTFVATGRTVFPMIWGESKKVHDWPRQTLYSALPKLMFLVILVVLGIYIPPNLNALIQEVAASLEGG